MDAWHEGLELPGPSARELPSTRSRPVGNGGWMKWCTEMINAWSVYERLQVVQTFNVIATSRFSQ